MQLNLQSPYFVLVLTFLIGLLPKISLAQESEQLVPREYHSIETPATTSNEVFENDELSIGEEKSYLKNQSVSFVSRDSISTRTSAATSPNKVTTRGKANNDSQKSFSEHKTTDKAEKNENEEKDDSVLSFNFLYYIFQKFKLSDIVDE